MPAPSTTGGLMGYSATVDTGQIADWIITDPAIDLTGASGTLTTNGIYLYAFVTRTGISASGVRFHTGSTATGTSDAGIYDSSGNLLVHTGTVNNVASSDMTNNFTSNYQLSPGQYFLALACSNNTDTYFRTGGASLVSPLGPWRIATNTATAGVLPSTTGGYGAATIVVGMSLVFTGSLA